MGIIDFDDEFGTGGGQAVTATGPGTKVKDARVARDWAAGEVVFPYARVVEAFNNLTSLDIAIQGCDDVAGTNPVDLTKKNVLLAGLALNALIPLPGLAAGVPKRCLRAYFTVNGAAPSTGKIVVGLRANDQRLQDGLNAL